eukprot:scaffold315831_cov35-Prasinocladus_malaysianus.AAC.1
MPFTCIRLSSMNQAAPRWVFVATDFKRHCLRLCIAPGRLVEGSRCRSSSFLRSISFMNGAKEKASMTYDQAVSSLWEVNVSTMLKWA